jgi:glycosyltransferase involved in cell wall biosynthesis
MTQRSKKRLLVFIVAYNAEKTIESVLTRIPASLGENFDVEILVIDDASKDETFERSEIMRRAGRLPFPLHVLFNPRNQGYGGNQKIGFHYAVENNFDIVALVHGDGQYAPECLPDLAKPLFDGEADAVFGSRMLTRHAALQGGMPLYKYVGNKILTYAQNSLLRAKLSEFHSGYRLYSVKALAHIPFHKNTNDFHFDTDIIIQLLFGGFRIKELPIPTYYGDEICHVNGLKYAWDVFITTLKARLQQMNLFYHRKFDFRQGGEINSHYEIKLGYTSPQSIVLDHVSPGTRVLDLGCAGGYLGVELEKRGCKVTGVDVAPLAPNIHLTEFRLHDLNAPLPVDASAFDSVLLMDVIEHLASPEAFVENLQHSLGGNDRIEILVSTGNVAFLPVRLMLLLGQFNYGKRGILDITHTRLFTFGTLRHLFEQNGFEIVETRGVPAPFPLAIKNAEFGRLMTKINEWFIAISKSLFAYQIFVVVRPLPTLERLLNDAHDSSWTRSETLKQRAAE